MKPKIAVCLAMLCLMLTAGGAILHNYAASRQAKALRAQSFTPGGHNPRLLGRKLLTARIVPDAGDEAARQIRERKAAQRRLLALAAKRGPAVPIASAPESELAKRSHNGVMKGLELVTVEGKLQIGLLP